MTETKVIDEINSGLKALGDKIDASSKAAQKIQTDREEDSKLIKSIQTENSELKKTVETLQKDLKETRKHVIEYVGDPYDDYRPKGGVSNRAAKELGAEVIAILARKGAMDSIHPLNPQAREAVMELAAKTLRLTGKAALTTSDIPLPVSYSREIRDLIPEYGAARRNLRPKPLNQGTNTFTRRGTAPTFARIAISGTIGEKALTRTTANMTPEKVGGILRVPREIEEGSLVSFGQLLAQEAALEFARVEDNWMFLADGDATNYGSQTGICKTAQSVASSGAAVTLAATKTSPSDVTKANLQNLRSKIANAAKGRAKYYLNRSMESFLRGLNTQSEPNFFVYRPNGTAAIDGFEVEFVEILQSYTEDAAAGAYVAVFGDLQWWYFGENGSPRVDRSTEVYFVNDEIGIRFIEAIAVNYQAIDAAAVLVTAAA